MPRPIAAVGNLLVDVGTGATTFFLITFLVPIFHLPNWLLVIIIGCYYYTAEAIVIKAVMAVFNLCLVSNWLMFSTMMI